MSWIAKISNQSILKEIYLEYSLEGLMLKLQYFGHWMQRADPLEKTLILGRIKCKKNTGVAKDGRLEGKGWKEITDSKDMSLNKL